MPNQQQIQLNEKQYVEEPFLRQLERLGWDILRAGEEGKGDPAITFREGFNEVLLTSKLKESLLHINPWLKEDQLPAIIREITDVNIVGGLVEKNRFILEKLLENVSAENRQTHRSDTVRFIDFKNPDKNHFLAISQFKVNIPGTEKHIIPDIVLFINGLPIAVIECKSAYLSDPMGEGIEQLMRYQNRRGETKEGNPKLFWYNQLLIATSKQIAKYSTITGEFEHFIEWKDPHPFKLSDIDTEGGGSVTSQHVLIQGMLAREILLDIIRSFIVFAEDKGLTVKLPPRYQQYRTVCKIVNRLKSNKTPTEKGGTVWHTQGSGKSLAMMFTVRKMYHDPELSGYKIVFVNDRKDLRRQLSDTARSIGHTVINAKRVVSLQENLRTNTPDLIMAMIQAFQPTELQQEFPVLNTSEKILVLADESHREKSKFLAANMRQGLPNAVYIGFTGTPTEIANRTFGEYIDKYSIKQAVEDGVTVEIVYEGRAHKSFVPDPEAMDQRFADVFGEAKFDPETREIIKRGEWRAYLEANKTIQTKAKDMLEHYLAHIFPNGFKAQVVAVSRVASIRYKQAFDMLLADKGWLNSYIAKLEKEKSITIDPERIKRLKAEVVITGSLNDPPEMQRYTDGNQHEGIIKSFKLPFDKVGENGLTGDVGIIVVQSMLITGFDAPVEQVMYLDDVIREHSLLQAIARVNRVAKNKKCGFVVDYVGIVKHLREALSVYSEEDVNEILQVVKDEAKDLDGLVYSHEQLVSFFKKYDVEDLNDIDVCVDILADEEVRNDFLVLFKIFSDALDRVLPKPEALKFVSGLKKFSFIGQVARNRYRPQNFNLRDMGKKIRDIIDEFLVSKGIDPKIPPVPIFDEKFKAKIKKEKSERAKAETLRSAIDEYIREHIEEDPELLERFSERLQKLLQEYQENWALLAKELEALLEELRKGRKGERAFGFDPKSELPFLGLLKKEVFGVQDISELDEKQIDLLVQATQDILERIKNDLRLVGFWNNIPEQRRLKGFIASHLLTAFRNNREIFNHNTAVAQKIMELAYHLNNLLLNAGN